jgi:hypothetical protein
MLLQTVGEATTAGSRPRREETAASKRDVSAKASAAAAARLEARATARRTQFFNERGVLRRIRHRGDAKVVLRRGRYHAGAPDIDILLRNSGEEPASAEAVWKGYSPEITYRSARRHSA